MGRKTQFLNLHLADANDVYDVEVDQNQNFEKIDKKLKELDTGKETAFSKKSGFNLDKTDEYNLDDTNKLGTAKALKRLFDEIVSRIKLINWDNLTGKPKTFPPNSHTHDDRYYTEIETDDRITGLAGIKNGKFPLSSAIKGNVYLLEQTQKFYVCTQNYNGTTISVPNTNFTELSVYENMNRLENLIKVDTGITGNYTKVGAYNFTFPKIYKQVLGVNINVCKQGTATTLENVYVTSFNNTGFSFVKDCVDSSRANTVKVAYTVFYI